jgi:signal transduction histidine kinase
LRIATSQAGETVQLQISDTGPGIGEEDAKKIFEPFYTTKEQGLGLGMPYASKIVEQHGGIISVASKLGEGTTVSITLPAAKTEVADAS